MPSAGTCQLMTFASDQSDSNVSVPSACCWKKRNCLAPFVPPTAVAVTCTVEPGTVACAFVSSTDSGVYSFTCAATHASTSKSAGNCPIQANVAFFMPSNSLVSVSFASSSAAPAGAYTYTSAMLSAVACASSPATEPPLKVNSSSVLGNTRVFGAMLLMSTDFTPGPKYAEAGRTSDQSIESAYAPSPAMPRTIR